LDPADPDRICRIGLGGIQLSSEAPRESIVGSKDFRSRRHALEHLPTPDGEILLMRGTASKEVYARDLGIP
jgi:hypothetical protein